jgi:hypothetical protein
MCWGMISLLWHLCTADLHYDDVVGLEWFYTPYQIPRYVSPSSPTHSAAMTQLQPLSWSHVDSQKRDKLRRNCVFWRG